MSGESAILNTARELSAIIRKHDLDAAIIGGVAVVLHGHVRTTLDVDVYTSDIRRLSTILEEHGFEFDAEERHFQKDGVPVDLVTIDQLYRAPSHTEDIGDIRIVSLVDLINMKLRSGTADILRAQDLADVIGLLRHHKLGAELTPRIEKSLRREFRTLVKAIAEQSK